MAPNSRHHDSDSSSRRLAAIAGQLGSVTSSSVQALARKPLASSRPQREWKHLPSFRELPREGGFPGCAWNVWGKGDTLGTVNMLTDAVVSRTAKEEIRTGHAISLNLPAHIPLAPFFHRKAFEHKIWGKTGEQYTDRRNDVQASYRRKGYEVEIRTEGDDPSKAPVADEELHFNSQSGTQFDGLRHFGHLSLNVYYGGIPRKDLQAHFDGKIQHTHNFHADLKSQSVHLGIQDWAAHGIVGRGVLLDIWGYLWRKHGRAPYDPCTTHAITLDIVKEVARAQGVRFRQGDILFLRCGFTQRYQNSTEEERQRWGQGGSEQLAGLEQGEDMLEFLWDNHFAAVASDVPALERWPAPKGTPLLHETLLAFFGMPIGELFDLEELCLHAQKTRRWTFFLSSWPMNIYGGVASPANAAAIF